MKNQLLVFLVTLSTFCAMFCDSVDVEENINSEIHELIPFLSGGEKQFLDASHLNSLSAAEIKFQWKLNGETALFHAVKSVPSMKGFFYGTSGGKSLNLHENTETKALIGSMVDSNTNEIHQITMNEIGETEIITKNAHDFIDNDDEMVVPVTRTGFFGERSMVESRSLNDSTGDSIDVMVVWTKKAECKNSGLSSSCYLTLKTRENIIDKIQLAVEETNTAFALSGISSQLRLVHAYLDDSYNEKDVKQALQDVTFQHDGKMDDVHKTRNIFGADVVSLWIDSPSGCGLAWTGPYKDYMFSVVSWSCATGYFSFGHEIVHNIGCNHDRGSEKDCTDAKSNYGYRDPNGKFRDIMSYNCRSGQCDNIASDSCPRVQRFSNTASSYEGVPIGNAKSDCASHVNAYSAIIASYFPAKTDKELVELGQFKKEGDSLTSAPIAKNCKLKRKRCGSRSVCCSNKCHRGRCK